VVRSGLVIEGVSLIGSCLLTCLVMYPIVL
jgi:hypothetical protein